MTRFTRALLLTAMTAILTAIPLGVARAQSSPGLHAQPAQTVELKIVFGYSGFIDESMINHAALGAAVGWRATPRLAAELELLHLRGPGRDRDWLIVPTLAWDLRANSSVVPYVVGGAGWIRTTLPVGVGPYTSTSWTGGAGGGVRIALSPSTSLSLEGRLGSEPLTRLTAAIGWRLGTGR